MPRYNECLKCDGTGWVNASDGGDYVVKCPACEGDGTDGTGPRESYPLDEPELSAGEQVKNLKRLAGGMLEALGEGNEGPAQIKKEDVVVDQADNEPPC